MVLACKKEVLIKEGPFAGLQMESVEYEPAWSLGANCDNDDVASVAKLIDQCNDRGMDPIELGNAFSMWMEATPLATRIPWSLLVSQVPMSSLSSSTPSWASAE